MNAFDTISTGVTVLGWCLLHFFWQAAAVGVAYALARAFLPRGNPRYLAALLAMVALATCPVATAWHEFRVPAQPVDLADVVVTGSMVASSSLAAASPTWRPLLDAALPWLVLVWAVGVGMLGMRVLRQWQGLRVLLREAERLPEWQARAQHFVERLGLRRMVPVLASVRVSTPTLVGWVRPAVVLPLAVLARMPAAQIDLVLAHELAHLKRFDHIVNLFQVVLETLFFYHPVVHWISREARNERELCCDALALRTTGGERRDFVAALAGLEELRAGHADLVLAASGGVLVERAWFIAGAAPRRTSRHVRGSVLLMLAITTILGLGGLWWRDAAWQQRIAALVSANNASLLRWHGNATWVPALSLPFLQSQHPRVLPVPYAAVPVTKADVMLPPAVPVRVEVSKPALNLARAEPHLMPIVAVALAPESAMAPAAPRPLHAVPPAYPPEALLAGIPGRVVIEFALDATGVPRNLEVVDSSAGQFDAAALQALAAWRFAPPAVAGRRYRQAFTFQLGATAANDAAAARACLITTGTHICRHASDFGPDVRILQIQP
jgi:TonB family protein